MTPLHGLVLVGGRNRRMGRDKERLRIAPQQMEMREYLYGLLNNLCGDCIFSINGMQVEDPYYRDKNYVVDLEEDQGPMCGIVSAMKQFPGYSFLALACDMPRIHSAMLQKLIKARRGEGVFFEVNACLEPLCGIYECEMYPRLHHAWRNRQLGLQLMLVDADINRIKLDSMELFLNVNTQDELKALTQVQH